MATITPPDLAKLAGIPSQGSDTILVTPEGLITGNVPDVLTEDMTVAASQNIPAYTAVGFDGSGNIIKAVLGTTAAIGFAVHDIVTDASGTLKAFPIYRAGCFNPDFLLWDATYNTAEKKKKLEAFRGAPSPTNIIMRPIKSATVTLP